MMMIIIMSIIIVVAIVTIIITYNYYDILNAVDLGVLCLSVFFSCYLFGK